MRYEVNLPDYHGEDSWHEYDAMDEEEAALAFGQSYNEDGDYSLMNHEVYVRVREVGTDKIVVCCVSAEPDVHYSSNEMDSLKCKECKVELIEKIKRAEKLYNDQYCSRECYCKYHGIKN